MNKKKSKLTAKQAKFVAELVVQNGNQTQAAIAAGYSERSAQQIGSENMSKPVVAEAYLAFRRRIAERLEVSADRVTQQLMHAAERAAVEGDLGAEIRALSQLAKITGASTERKVSFKATGDLAELNALLERVRRR
jgi:phage terminase small subunit